MTGQSPSGRIAISWAELLLVLLLVTGGTGVWALTTSLLEEKPPATKSDGASSTEPDDEIRRLRTSLEGFETALVQETVEISRQQALRTWLRERYPGLSDSAATSSGAPAEARSADEAAARAIAISGGVSQSIEKAIMRVKAAIEARNRAVAATRAERDEKSAAEKKDRVRWQQIIMRSMAATAVLVVFAFWCFVLTRRQVKTKIQTKLVIGAIAGLLAFIVAYELLGAPALMIGAFGLAAIVLGAVVVRA